MQITKLNPNHWQAVKEIYLEAFPKSEREPFPVLKRTVKKGKARILTAVEDGKLLGFVMVTPFADMMTVDYLAVSQKIRSRGTGSRLIQEICRQFPNRRIALLIERPDDKAPNRDQRLARRRFYLKNDFVSADIFLRLVSGEMEVLVHGGEITAEEYLRLEKYALGRLCFRLSGIRVID